MSAECSDYEGVENMDKGRMECWDQNSQAVSVHLPRIMIAAEKSGGGKTLFTCALLSLLKEKIRGSEERRVGKECRSRWSPYH